MRIRDGKIRIQGGKIRIKDGKIRIKDGKKLDPDLENIPHPQHCLDG
jgi:hypothetical protein